MTPANGDVEDAIHFSARVLGKYCGASADGTDFCVGTARVPSLAIHGGSCGAGLS